MMDYQIMDATEYGVDAAADYFHSKWGNSHNHGFYLDAIAHSAGVKQLPKFFLLLKGQQAVGCYGLITNDFISRCDLWPWLACLFIEESERGQRLSQGIFVHAAKQAGAMGFEQLYLTTDHQGLYEKFGWQRLADGYSLFGAKTRIYQHSVDRLLRLESEIPLGCRNL
ncbi:GNAT family N-acetyltransferase [Bowmanella pacifica]|nr:GNAT family N-acetyltransferase [Bowmanella pacifica]